MKHLRSIGPAAVMAIAVAATLGAVAGPASAATSQSADHHGDGRTVFVQNDNTAGNQVVAYDRARNGSLTQAGTYSTGGLGGILAGSVVDHLASQGSLTYDRQHSTLYAVNAGSNTIAVFSVRGHHLRLRQVIPSGGTFPVSIAVHGDLVYVLNAENGGSVQGYSIRFDFLLPIFGSNRTLGLDPTATPQFTHTPGQVAFSPDGSQLIVTTKANGNDIDVFRVFGNGRLSFAPYVNSEAGALPFAVTFDRAGNLVVAETGIGSLVTFSLSEWGQLTELDAVSSAPAATCWVAATGGSLYASNAGSASVSQYHDSGAGILTLDGQSSTDPGTV